MSVSTCRCCGFTAARLRASCASHASRSLTAIRSINEVSRRRRCASSCWSRRSEERSVSRSAVMAQLRLTSKRGTRTGRLLSSWRCPRESGERREAERRHRHAPGASETDRSHTTPYTEAVKWRRSACVSTRARPRRPSRGRLRRPRIRRTRSRRRGWRPRPPRARPPRRRPRRRRRRGRVSSRPPGGRPLPPPLPPLRPRLHPPLPLALLHRQLLPRRHPPRQAPHRPRHRAPHLRRHQALRPRPCPPRARPRSPPLCPPWLRPRAPQARLRRRRLRHLCPSHPSPPKSPPPSGRSSST
mmetsp:Transcript_43831/g.141381  ORF Transcript_43831/g.141381 Transcript_43831/m.141381 type:complete len:300 (-) Transcript_43831:1758-2657(-)